MKKPVLERVDANASPRITLGNPDARVDSVETEITVWDIQYLLIPNHNDFLPAHTSRDPTPTLVLVYLVSPGSVITRFSLESFYNRKLLPDDVFQPAFFHNLVFYGSAREDVKLEDGAMRLLREWGVGTMTFLPGEGGKGDLKLKDRLLGLLRGWWDGMMIFLLDRLLGGGLEEGEGGRKKKWEEEGKGKKEAEAPPPGPYVFWEGKTWQPWRVYRDDLGVFMRAFKPGTDGEERR